MFLIDRCVLPPGACYVCRSGAREGDRGIIDTMRAITDGRYEDGRLYVCQACATEMAMHFAFIPPELADRLVAERDLAVRQATELRDQAEQLSAAITALQAVTPIERIELPTTPRYACPECLAAGELKDCKNPQGLARHRQTKHETPSSFLVAGDAVDELTADARSDIEVPA